MRSIFFSSSIVANLASNRASGSFCVLFFLRLVLSASCSFCVLFFLRLVLSFWNRGSPLGWKISWSSFWLGERLRRLPRVCYCWWTCWNVFCTRCGCTGWNSWTNFITPTGTRLTPLTCVWCGGRLWSRHARWSSDCVYCTCIVYTWEPHYERTTLLEYRYNNYLVPGFPYVWYVLLNVYTHDQGRH